MAVVQGGSFVLWRQRTERFKLLSRARDYGSPAPQQRDCFTLLDTSALLENR